MSIIKAECPHCGNENLVLVHLNNPEALIVVYCDQTDSPGCGEPFLVNATITITPHVYRFEEVRRED